MGRDANAKPAGQKKQSHKDFDMKVKRVQKIFTPAEPNRSKISCDEQKDNPCYEPCDIQYLRIQFNIPREKGDELFVTILDTKIRDDDTFNKIGPPSEYASLLCDSTVASTHGSGSYDLILETLSDFELSEYTRREKKLKSLDVEVLSHPSAICTGDPSFNESGHAIITSIHPKTEIRKIGGCSQTLTSTVADDPLSIAIFAPKPKPSRTVRLISAFWEFWPFGDYREERYLLEGVCCGHSIPPNEPVKQLKALLIVKPNEGWSVKIGMGSLIKRKHAVSREYTDKNGKLIPKNQRETVFTVTRKEADSSTEQEKEIIKRGQVPTKHYTLSETAKTVFGTKSEVQFSTEPNEEIDNDLKSRATRKIEIKRILGGEEYSLNLNEKIDNFIKFIEVIRKITELWDGLPKAGLNASWSIDILAGSLEMKWGYRWPTPYQIEHHVGYVERYLAVTGSVEVINIAVDVFFGIEFDPWYLPVNIVAKFYLSITLPLTISATADFSVTNCKNSPSANPTEIKGNGELIMKLGFDVGGRVGNYAVKAELFLEANIVCELKGQFSFSKCPELFATMACSPVLIKGQIITRGSKVTEYRGINPIKIVKKEKSLWKNERIW